MKRDPHLIPLSHDHQHALALALRLRRCASATAQERRALAHSAIRFQDEVLGAHAGAEEQVVASALTRLDDPRLVDAYARLLGEHASLASRIAELGRALDVGEELDAARLERLGRELARHVRWEERELFQLLQELLGDDIAEVTSGIARVG